ncbi:hypothetical protein Taro_023036 [Colocasia esculenta]|uniref:RING-CH-type domain-containing protein n=1 Tax=Colocasia esculenta TaxID=4460 RepID=A0A843VG60_COLES|nr:hypothetical protein [Colocasia esculenta]
MDVKADCVSTGLTLPGPPPPLDPAQAPETATRLSSADAAGGPADVGGDGVSKSGADAVVLDLGKVLPAPQEEQKKEGSVDAAAARVQGGCPSVVVDIKSENVKGVDAGGVDGRSWDAEKECRICHVNPDRRESSDGSELIQLGCGCKNELGIAHRHCAEAWFKLKGNR